MSRPPASPCIGVCKMDARSGLCVGCLRTIDEIAAWSGLDDGQRRAVMLQLPARRPRLRAAAAAAAESPPPNPP